jgi:hypothetical protein
MLWGVGRLFRGNSEEQQDPLLPVCWSATVVLLAALLQLHWCANVHVRCSNSLALQQSL